MYTALRRTLIVLLVILMARAPSGEIIAGGIAKHYRGHKRRLKYKTALSIAYGAGLRGGEVVMLRVGDIDSKRMLIRVELGKGRKDASIIRLTLRPLRRTGTARAAPL